MRMSLRATILNHWLRWTEKPFLTRATSPRALRISFELKAALFFRGPLGVLAEWADLAGKPALKLRATTDETAPVLLYFHGGGFVFGSPRTIAKMVAHLAKKSNARAVLPQYPLATEAPFPAATEHAYASYRALVDQGVNPAQIIIGGDSAGGNLALSLLAQIIAAGVFALSPVTDLTYSGDSVTANAETEVVLPASRMTDMTEAYIPDHPRDDPRVSPLFADFHGAPPVWLAVADTEILRDDTLRMAERLRAQGAPVDLTVEHDLPHVWPMFHTLIPEAHETLNALADWIRVQTRASAATR
ncbi:alpha/beta hydrolase [Tateyamaria sp.]|uniref:alpha/beta hydrolase n=1 Tax=Tateyamaria sp. TaxID=1929288 RepID=UPI003B21C2C4